jgi:SAM-dependent methyltransferase
MGDTSEDQISHFRRRIESLETYTVQAFWMALDRAYEATLNDRKIQCIVCGTGGRRGDFPILTERCMFGGGTLERYQCPVCETVFGPQKCLDLPEEFVAQDYAILYRRYAEANSTEKEIKTFKSLDPVLGGVYLNWGCGTWNETIPKLRADGYDVWGFEPTGTTSSYVVTQREQISARFDGIFSNNVIEHFREPRRQFEEFRRLLKPTGRMAHSSPCYEYAYAFTRFHNLFLLGRSPEILAERTGFRVRSRVKDGEYINVIFEVAAASETPQT